ncbi:YerC/YecD family TrpR-related protein [Sporosarcina aquimarina]|uniref:YerC/YecD family TrpR-related protein n=1 Tax=Sporosarcina aquimarina TaxID=114975 RepID=A0ABU4G2H1_9BACL|nr:YerC/YecD family TrpR-related protein [Sporosarcina aquimarina]MDW0111086.1 YerC/YecD family TrpR-related protein [Sporosarcina aquimarina]
MLEKIKGEQTDQLFRAMLELKDLEECYAFFDDLCTIGEVQSLSQRLDVAVKLKKKYTYDKIQNKTGASTATISRIRRCVDYGSGGYNLILDRLNEKQNDSADKN